MVTAAGGIASTSRTALATALALLLGACASTPVRDRGGDAATGPSLPINLAAAPHAEVPIPLAPMPELAPLPPVAAPIASPWERLRTRFAMPGCEYSPQVQRWARTYTQGPDRFAATLKRSLPFLLLVLDELERQDLPGEFALLPYLESHYEPVPSRGNAPAGMWQIMPDTARHLGIPVSTGYDGRLDAWTSSTAAVSLLKRYQDEFGDWRLVDMAFNAGEYRVKQLLRQTRGAPLSTADLAKLKLSPITHEHLAKLLALGCVIDDPARFGVTLPEPEADDHLERVSLSAPLDIRVAARLADVPEETIKRYNAGHRQTRMAHDAPLHLMLPRTSVALFRERYAQLAPSQWSTWEAVKLREPRGVSELAGKAAVPIDLVGAANGVDADREFSAGATVFLPSALGRSIGTLPPAPIMPGAVDLAADKNIVTITVKNGDSLWTLSRRHSVSVADLQRLNGLNAKSSIKPGQRLKLRSAAAPQ